MNSMTEIRPEDKRHEVDRDDIYGDGVNVAARLKNLAEPGGICISGTVYDAIGNKLPTLHYTFMGGQSVKNIAQPVRAYRVAAGTRGVRRWRLGRPELPPDQRQL